jgi:gliding motility-associated-like protein
MIRARILLLLCLFLRLGAYAQPCSSLGQTPSTAFPVCGTGTFIQTTVPLCGSFDMPVPCDRSDGAIYMDKNPYWYKFTCFTGGTLGFLITPMDLNDDYDWQLFDITGRNPNDVLTDASLFVACNWSGLSGLTGASNAGNSLIACAGGAYPTFSIMPVLQVGHEYILLVSHFTDTQAGYTLEFNGGTAVITDPLVPAFVAAIPVTCDGTEITIKVNKKLRCNTLAADGSDFSIAPSGTIVSATGYGCTGFDLDSVRLTLAGPLVPGNYTVSMKTGNDGNTLLDICGTALPSGDNKSFTIVAGPPLPMGTVAATACYPQFITVNFADPIKCSSIAADGTDFLITGASTVNVNGATFSCNANGETNSINVQFASQILVNGNYQVEIRMGSDANTLNGRCNRNLGAGSIAPFTVSDAPVTISALQFPECSPTLLKIGLSGLIDCASIALDGTDFIISGPSTVTIISASAVCANTFTDSVSIQLSGPIIIGGNYTVAVVTGSDGNSLFNSCNKETLPGTNLGFLVRQAVFADFTYNILPGCSPADIEFIHDGANGVTEWNWVIDGDPSGNAAICVKPLVGAVTIELTVSNGFCEDTKTETIDIPNTAILTDFKGPDQICPGKPTEFLNETEGPVDNWLWDFGNGVISQFENPALQLYPVNVTAPYYTISLTASNNAGCVVTKTKDIEAMKSCIIAVPTAFTPNNDGLNDFLYPLNAFGANNLLFRVYNRWGQIVFESRDWTRKWDGKLGGIPQSTGVYVWTLEFIDKDDGKPYSLKGKTTLIR